MIKLHANQKAILEILRSNREGLSLRDIAVEIGVSSPNTVLFHINQLEKKGLLRKDPANPQNFIVLDSPNQDIVNIPIFAMAQCGPNGLLADDNIIDHIRVSTKAFGIKDNAFIVKARGDSMEPLVYENDFVVAERTQALNFGDIGVFVHNDMPKIKKFIKSNGHFLLVSLNHKYTDEEIKSDEIQIVGKVKSVIKFGI